MTYHDPTAGLGPRPEGSGFETFLRSLGTTSVRYGLSAGLVGGFLAALISHPFDNVSSNLEFSSALMTGIVGAVLGFTIMGWEGLTSGAYQRILHDSLFGAIVGFIAGCIGGAVAQELFTKMLNDLTSASDPKAYLARGLAWAVFGALIGGGLGIRAGSRKILSGVVGGLVGGAAGGLGFEFVEAVLNTQSDLVLQIIGFMITGVGIGLGIGVAERLMRDVWIRFDTGGLRGREYNLFAERTRIGRDVRNEISLPNDPTLLPLQATLSRSGDRLIIQADPSALTKVNDAPVTHCELGEGDRVSLGQNDFTVMSRSSAPGPIPGPAHSSWTSPAAAPVPPPGVVPPPAPSSGVVYPVSDGPSSPTFSAPLRPLHPRHLHLPLRQ